MNQQARRRQNNGEFYSDPTYYEIDPAICVLESTLDSLHVSCSKTVIVTSSPNEPHPVQNGVVKQVISSIDHDLDVDIYFQCDLYLQDYKKRNLDMLRKLMKGEINDEDVSETVKDHKIKERELISKIIHNGNQVYKKVKDKHEKEKKESYKKWEKRELRRNETMNEGVIGMPYNIEKCTKEQLEYFFTLCPIFECIEAADMKQPECPCISQIWIAGRDAMSIFSFAAANNYYEFLIRFSKYAEQNRHFNDLFCVCINSRRHHESLLENAMFQDHFAMSGNHVKRAEALRILLDPRYIYHRCYTTEKSGYQTPRYSMEIHNSFVTYRSKSREDLFTILIAEGHENLFVDYFTKNLDKIEPTTIAQLLIELVCTDNAYLFDKLWGKTVQQWFKHHLDKAPTLLQILFLDSSQNLNDTCLHTAILRGHQEMLTAVLKCCQWMYKQLNLIFDLTEIINVDQLNPIEFSIDQNQPAMTDCLLKYGKPSDKYNMIRMYSSLLNGADSISFFVQTLMRKTEQLQYIHLLSLVVTQNRDGLIYPLLCMYKDKGLLDVLCDDLDEALWCAIYHRNRAEVHKADLNNQSREEVIKKMRNRVAILLLAGARLWKTYYIKEKRWSNTVRLSTFISSHFPSEIKCLIKEVEEKRKSVAFDRVVVPLEEAAEKVYTHFGLSK